MQHFTRWTHFLPNPLPDEWTTQPLQPQPTTETPVEESQEDVPAPRNDQRIKLGDHWAIVGPTNSGKTYFTIRGLLPHLAYLYPHAKRYILDSTDDPGILRALPPDIQQVYGNHRPDLLYGAKMTQLWTPRNSKLPHDYAEWFSLLNDSREPQIVMIDEIASITGEALDEFEVLLKQMRKHGGTVIGLTQQIAKVTTTLFSQISHYVQFSLGNEQYDMRQARAYLHMSKEEQRDPLYRYGFFHRYTRNNSPFGEYANMDAFFRRK